MRNDRDRHTDKKYSQEINEQKDGRLKKLEDSPIYSIIQQQLFNT